MGIDGTDVFVGREREIAMLEGIHRGSGLDLFVLYGRRRVGKSFLLKEFCKGRRSIYYNAADVPFALNMQGLRSASGIADLPMDAGFETLLEAVAAKSRDGGGRPVLVLDEYQYLAKGDPSVQGILKAFMDRHEGDLDMMVVLCGSSVSFFASEVLSERAPLYGRSRGSHRLEPMKYFEADGFLKGFSELDAMRIYGMVGGIPKYLAMFDPRESMSENVERVFLSPGTSLWSEPENLIRREVGSPMAYNGVIRAIASGKSKVGEIADAVGDTTSAVTKRLETLSVLGIVERRVPMLSERRKSTKYELADPLFRFCHGVLYRFPRPDDEEEARLVAERVVEALPAYSGRSFETVCRQYVRKTMRYPEVGAWWGRDPSARKGRADAEIDIVGVDPISGEGRPVLFGECKCRGEPADVGVLRTLEARTSQFDVRKTYAVFSCGGFTEGLKAEASDAAALVSLEDLYSFRRAESRFRPVANRAQVRNRVL